MQSQHSRGMVSEAHAGLLPTACRGSEAAGAGRRKGEIAAGPPLHSNDGSCPTSALEEQSHRRSALSETGRKVCSQVSERGRGKPAKLGVAREYEFDEWQVKTNHSQAKATVVCAC